MNLIEQLQKAGIPLAEQEPMTRRTTFGIGGPALLLRPRSRAELQAAMTLCREAGEEPFILGRGSNLLVSDSGISRPVIQLDGDFTAITREGNTLRCGAGASLIAVCRAAAENSLSGIEWGYGIPGSLGGGVYMNAGAYGGEIAQVAEETTVLMADGTRRVLRGAEQAFAYRTSAFERMECMIVKTVFALRPGDADEIGARMRELMEKRRASQPLELPSAGSTFKRPAGAYAGALIEASGLKGRGVGGAEVSRKHAGFVVNRGGATARDVLETIKLLQETVYADSGFRLEPEVRIW